MQETVLMVLGAGRGQVPMIRAAVEDGMEVVVVDRSRNSPGLRMAGRAFCHDLADVDAALRIAREHEIRGIATLGADYPMPLLARVREVLGLPGPTVEAAHRATNKRLMRAAFEPAGLSILCRSRFLAPARPSGPSGTLEPTAC